MYLADLSQLVDSQCNGCPENMSAHFLHISHHMQNVYFIFLKHGELDLWDIS